MATSQHYRFPRTSSVPRLLASLETVLRQPEAVYEEFQRLQEFCRDHVTGDTHTATQPANRGKNRYTTEKINLFLINLLFVFKVTVNV